MVSYSTHWQ